MSKRRLPKPVVPPTDVKQWWLSPHCGPGTTDSREICGFCGASGMDCALITTEALPNFADACGGSGFWCKSCGRFWAQDSCGESGGSEHVAADGAKLTLKDDKVHCCCGQYLMDLPEED